MPRIRVQETRVVLATRIFLFDVKGTFPYASFVFLYIGFHPGIKQSGSVRIPSANVIELAWC
jgi:hypothetical protein